MVDFYLEDDDELRKMRERFQMSGSAQPEYGAALGGGGDYGAPPSDLDPRMVQSFLGQRPEAEPSRGGYPIPQREGPSFLEDAALPALAGVADIIANRGRGLGQITQGVIAGKESRRNREAQQFEADRGAYMKQQDMQADAEARRQSYGVHSQNAAMRQAELDLAVLREKRITDQFTRGQPSPEMVQAEHEAELRLKNAQAAEAEARAGRDPNAITPNQQAQLDATKEERRERRLDRDESRAERAAREQETNRLKRVDDTRAQEGQDRIAASDFLEKTKETRGIARTLQTLEPLVESYKGKDIPGVGTVDARVPGWMAHPFDEQQRKDAIAVEQAREGAAAAYRYANTGAAASIPEDERLRIVNGMRNGATEEEFLLGLQTMSKYTKGELGARATASPDIARRALQADGTADWALGKQLPPADLETRGDDVNAPLEPPPTYRTQSGQLQPAGPPAGDTLQTTGQRPGQVPRVDDYLEDLKRRTKTPGVVYRP